MTMNHWRTGVCAAASFCLASAVAATELDPAPEPVRLQITAEAERFDVPGIAVAAIRDGNVAWIEVQGKAAEDRPLDRDTQFNVASLTKPIFATMVMGLVQAGEFDLDAPLSRHWTDPDVAEDPRNEQLTARLALSHQSGFPNWRGRNPLAFQFEPGARHEYSGEGFEYVRRAVERSTEQSMPELMARYVTGPAAMADARFGWSDAIAATLATGYREDGSAMDMAYLEQRKPNAAANTFATIEDVAHFAAWVARGADLEPALFAEITRPQAMHDNPAEYFSIGWRLTMVGETPVLSHDGREDGLRTLMVVDPQTRDGLVILTNSSNGELVTRGIVAAALPEGDALNAQIDRDIWHFIKSQPPQMQAGLLGFIARSPSFTAKLLYAVDTTLIGAVDLSAEERRQAQRSAQALVGAHHDGVVDAEALQRHLALLAGDESDGAGLVDRFDADAAQSWIRSLETLETGSVATP
ncbi:MAG: serine hydrolase domain-containing protein [Pseudomonadota bacterium]